MAQSIPHGILNVYYDGESDSNKIPAPTYRDSNGTTLNPFDIILDSNGRATVYVQNQYAYRLEVYDYQKNLLWTTRGIQPSSGVAIDGQYVFSIIGDGYVGVESKTQGDRVNYSLSLNTYSKDAINGFYDDVKGNEALYNAINAEKTEREKADSQLANGIKKAKTEVKNTDGTITVTKSTDSTDGHDIYTIAGAGQTPNVSVTSNDKSIDVQETVIGNYKTFDLSIKTTETEYGKFFTTNGSKWIKSSGNMSADTNIKVTKGGKYHCTLIGMLNNSTASENYGTVQIYTGDSSYYTMNVDCSIVGNHSFEMSWDYYATLDYLATTMQIPTNFTITQCFLHIHRFDTAKGTNSGGGGSGDNDKVAVASGKNAGYLSDILQASPNSDIQLNVVGDKYMIDVLSQDTADPKLAVGSIDLVNTQNDGTQPWNVTDFSPGNYDNHNCYIYKRLADAKGQITKVDFAVGTVQLYGCIQIGIFDINGNLLGCTDYTHLTDGSNRKYTLSLHEAFDGALYLQRNTLYFIEVVYKGMEIIGTSHESFYNFDYSMMYNRYGYCGQGQLYDPTDMTFNNAANILYFLQFSGD